MKPRELARAVARAIGPLEKWHHQCHAASLAVVRSGLANRVARGTCLGVGGQHSWAVAGSDCYADDARIIDPTLWSYSGEEPAVLVCSARRGMHKPSGKGSIWSWGRPAPAAPGAKVVTLSPKARARLSLEARRFLSMVEPLDRRGWDILASAPVEGWPAGEILEAMNATRALAQVIPIDRLGMLTDLNPGASIGDSLDPLTELWTIEEIESR